MSKEKPIFVEEVFKDAGIPTHTFVESQEFRRTKVALRTPGKGVIIEGPSGIGKTSCVKKVIDSLEIDPPTFLSPLKAGDKEKIEKLLDCPDNAGTVIIDDFHRLDEVSKRGFANILKVGADESRSDFKLILIGINQAGDSLVNLNREINNRIDTIRFERNPEEKVRELISKGEKVMNIRFHDKEAIVKRSAGSFHVAQMLCKEMCIKGDVDESQIDEKELNVPLDSVVRALVSEMEKAYGEGLKTFARGNRNRSGGNRPYYRLLTFLSESEAGTISINDLKRQNPELKGSLVQITEKKNDCGKSYLEQLIERHEDIKRILYFDNVANTLTVEDPKVLFYLRNKDMEILGKECGFNMGERTYTYEYAISFAGENRRYAEALYEKLNDLNVTVFYDNDHKDELLGVNVDQYLAPIYSSDSHYVIVLLDEFYFKKAWTKFESEEFKHRFGENAVIPIMLDGYEPDFTSSYSTKGRLTFNTHEDSDAQITELAYTLLKKVES